MFTEGVIGLLDDDKTHKTWYLADQFPDKLDKAPLRENYRTSMQKKVKELKEGYGLPSTIHLTHKTKTCSLKTVTALMEIFQDLKYTDYRFSYDSIGTELPALKQAIKMRRAEITPKKRPRSEEDTETSMETLPKRSNSSAPDSEFDYSPSQSSPENPANLALQVTNLTAEIANLHARLEQTQTKNEQLKIENAVLSRTFNLLQQELLNLQTAMNAREATFTEDTSAYRDTIAGYKASITNLEITLNFYTQIMRHQQVEIWDLNKKIGLGEPIGGRPSWSPRFYPTSAVLIVANNSSDAPPNSPPGPQR